MENVFMYVSQCGAIRYISQPQTHNVDPSTHLGLQVVMVLQQPRTHMSKGWMEVFKHVGEGVNWMWSFPTQHMDDT